MKDQAEKLRELSKNALVNKKSFNKNLAHIIAITSGKGGVGKSNFAVNLALSLAQFDKKVFIVDADLGMANVDVIMGFISQYSMHDVITGMKRIDEVVLTGPYGVKILSGGSGICDLASLNEIRMQNIINSIVDYAENFDFVIFDTGAGISDNVLSFLFAADDVLLVTTPEPTSITDAYAIIKRYSVDLQNASMKLVINRVNDENESTAVTKKLTNVASKYLDISLNELGYIFDDVNVSKAVRAQNPLVIKFPNAPAAKCIMQIAKKIALGSETTEKKGFSGFLKNILNINQIFNLKKVGEP